MIFLRILGWLIIGLTAFSIFYSTMFHSKNYARIYIKALEEEEEGGASIRIRKFRANIYMWRTISFQVLKLFVIFIILVLMAD